MPANHKKVGAGIFEVDTLVCLASTQGSTVDCSALQRDKNLNGCVDLGIFPL